VDLDARVLLWSRLAHETAGAPCTRHSRAPFVFEGRKLSANLEQSVLRECEPVSVVILRG
jgi:hypothetical protein